MICQGVFLVLDLSLGIVGATRGFGCDGLAGEGPNEDLYSAAETKDKVEYQLLLDVAAQRWHAAILELLAGKDGVLVIQGDVFIVLGLGLNDVDGVGGLSLKVGEFVIQSPSPICNQPCEGSASRVAVNFNSLPLVEIIEILGMQVRSALDGK